MARTFVDAGEVGELLDISRPRFLSQRLELERAAAFPLPMPHSRRPLKWRRAQVLEWIETHGLPRADQAAQTPGGNVVRLMKKAAVA